MSKRTRRKRPPIAKVRNPNGGKGIPTEGPAFVYFRSGMWAPFADYVHNR